MPDGEEQVVEHVLSFLSSTLEIKEIRPMQDKKIAFSDFIIVREQRKLVVEGREIFLTYHEFDLLLFLSSHSKQVFTKEQIYEAVWDDIPIRVDAKVECIISSIRKKLRKYSAKEYIKTIWGVGYKFDPS